MKLKFRKLFNGIFLVASMCGSVYAQEVLTLEQAVRIAIENNYDIRISSNNLQIDEKNVSPANAGMLPYVAGYFSSDNSIENTSQTQSDGTVINKDGLQNFGLSYGVALDWTLFDGLKMFARHDQLKEYEKLGETELKYTIYTKVREVLTTYYTLVQQQQQLSAFDTALYISQMRVRLAHNRFTIGKASKLELLNAQVDLNTDTTNLLKQLELYKNTQIALNELLARDPHIVFSVTDTIAVDRSLSLLQLSELASQQNPLIKASVINKRITELELKQVKADRYPIIDLNTGYNFRSSESPLGFATESTGRGFNYGVTASMNLFNGFLQTRNEKIAAIDIENAALTVEQLNKNISTQLATNFQTYQTNLVLIDLEEKNVMIARQNLELTLEKFKLGSIAALEFRDAQLNYVIARLRFTNAQYEAKLSEIILKELAGNISF
jgi:outer membrane protein